MIPSVEAAADRPVGCVAKGGCIDAVSVIGLTGELPMRKVCMQNHQHRFFRLNMADGVEQLPRSSAVYCILNRITGRRYVGQARNVHRRCVIHRSELREGRPANMLMRRDLVLHGFDPFFFALPPVRLPDPGIPVAANLVELWWTIQLQAHDERFGYNLEAGHFRTGGAQFRDRERKLMRPNSRKYELLEGVDMYDPIHPALLGTWVRGS